jgi:crotonobetainyl-CoA:carnitine CoA-transferase CaiB-like acyl-CoA transferase
MSTEQPDVSGERSVAPPMGVPPSESPLLANVKILAFCHWLQGPAASQYLADLGADVIKIEPLQGSAERYVMGPGEGPDGASSLFIAGNRNQRSLAIDLKSQQGKEIVHGLLEEYDVIIENFRPGVMDKLGLSYEELSKSHPGLIFASATGYGNSGPLAKAPGQDLLAQALSGLIAASGSEPTSTGAAVVDQHGAALLAMSVLAAVVRRQTTGLGCRIEANLLNAAIDLQMEALTFFMNSGAESWAEVAERHESLATWYHAAPYGVYRALDGHLVLSIADLGLLASALPELEHIAVLNATVDRDAIALGVAEALSTRTVADISRALDGAGVWFAPVLSYEDVVKHPQIVHNEIIAEVGDGSWSARVVRHPVKYDGEVPRVLTPPPRLGAHTREILAGIGYTDAEIGTLFVDKIIVETGKLSSNAN